MPKNKARHARSKADPTASAAAAAKPSSDNEDEAYDVFEADDVGLKGQFDAEGNVSYGFDLANGQFKDEEIDSDEVRLQHREEKKGRKGMEDERMNENS
jgi:hypothetical protein